MKDIPIPPKLIENVGSHSEGQSWLAQLPSIVEELSQRWSLTLAEPFDAEASCSWVAPCTRADGSAAVFKLGWLHMEAEDEILGLRFWNGDPTAYLLEADPGHNALLLERCEPGTVLRTLPTEEQDVIIAGLMKRLWRKPSPDSGFRPLAEMVHHWMDEARKRAEQWPDPVIAEEGLRVYQSLLDSTSEHVLLATDLHAGNVLRAEREPWLVIDPKPFVGDPAYDATQHLFNCWQRLQHNPIKTIERFANLLDVDAERVRLWMFARVSTMEIGDPKKGLSLAQALAP